MAEASLPPDIQKMSFEEALTELQQIVGRLEAGQFELEKMIDAYERGAALKKHCEQKLSQAKQQIDKISLGAAGDPKAEPIDID